MAVKSGRKPKNIYRNFKLISERLKGVTIENMSFNKLIPLYDKDDAFFYVDPSYVSTAGGAINYEINPEPLILDKQILDYINSNYKYTEVLQVFGESMEPDIKDGSLIFVDKSKKDLNDKDIFVISTIDGIFIKKINLRDNIYYMKSNNPICNDIKLISFDVIGKVCGVIIKI